MGGCASRTAAGAPSPAADVQPTGRVSDRRASPKAHRRETLEARIERKSMESSGSANSISRRLSQVQPSPVVTQQRVLSGECLVPEGDLETGRRAHGRGGTREALDLSHVHIPMPTYTDVIPRQNRRIAQARRWLSEGYEGLCADHRPTRQC